MTVWEYEYDWSSIWPRDTLEYPAKILSHKEPKDMPQFLLETLEETFDKNFHWNHLKSNYAYQGVRKAYMIYRKTGTATLYTCVITPCAYREGGDYFLRYRVGEAKELAI